MMKIWKSVIAALAMSLLLAGMYGCHEGPAERAGKKIDKTVDQGGQQMEKAGKKIQDDIKGK
jgi:hypothetical protein